MTLPNFTQTPAIPDSLIAKEAATSCASMPPISSSITRCASTCSAPSKVFKGVCGSTLNSCSWRQAFHDLGLIKTFSSPDERFEVDGANAARQFLNAHNIPEDQVQAGWEAIALHTTPGIPKHMRPEVALLNSGVLLDVLGVGFEQFPVEARDEIVARYPRDNFKQGFIQEYFAGFAHKPATTYGTVNAGICERFIPGFKSPNACDLIAASPFPDSPVQSSRS